MYIKIFLLCIQFSNKIILISAPQAVFESGFAFLLHNPITVQYLFAILDKKKFSLVLMAFL